MIGDCMSKYKSKKITKNGYAFDSIKEYRRWNELVLLERAGQIVDLQRQVKYELIPSQRIGGKVVERPCTYVADFVYQKPVHKQYMNERGSLVFADGYETIVEDVKGYKKSTAYSVFAIKRKLMLQKYGIQIKEV